MSGFFFNCIFLFFFVKQNTAYEMRISDWSSDVCSSDLLLVHPDDRAVDHRVFEVRVARTSPHASRPSRAPLRCIVGVYIPSSRERLPGVFQRYHQRRLTLRQRLKREALIESSGVFRPPATGQGGNLACTPSTAKTARCPWVHPGGDARAYTL